MIHCQICLVGNDDAAVQFAQWASQYGQDFLWVHDQQTFLRSENNSKLTTHRTLTGPYWFQSEKQLCCQSVRGKITVQAETFVLAMGAQPARPRWMFDDARLLLGQSQQPWPTLARQVAIVGMGDVGQLALSQLPAHVERVSCLDAGRSLPHRLLARPAHPVDCRFSAENAVIGVESAADFLTIYLEDGERLQVDAAMVCCGSVGNTRHCGLAATGLMPDDRGKLWCNEDYQTWTPDIYALGRVVGYPQPGLPLFEQIEKIGTAILQQQRVAR